MGVDIHIHICKLDENTNLYSPIKLFKKNDTGGYEEVPVYEARNYDMFDILEGRQDDFPRRNIRKKTLDPSFREEIERDEEWCFSFSEVNLLEMKNYVDKKPMIISSYYGGEEEEVEIKSPVKDLYEDIVSYIKLYDDGIDFLSDYKIIYYFDC